MDEHDLKSCRSGGVSRTTVSHVLNHADQVSHDGAGIITHIWATLACESFLSRSSFALGGTAKLRPSVETPIGNFFGIGHGRTANYAWQGPQPLLSHVLRHRHEKVD